jgi:hypothetical protein
MLCSSEEAVGDKLQRLTGLKHQVVCLCDHFDLLARVGPHVQACLVVRARHLLTTCFVMKHCNSEACNMQHLHQC